jgi:transaldolase / glucose-6-phosphate isomerase
MQPTGVLDTAKATNPLRDLLSHGQSVWLDYIRRNLITSGELKRLIEEDGVRGMTSNPAIFEKAIVGSTDYTDFLESLNSRPELDAKRRYELLAIRDIQDAADLLKPVYDASNWKDGYVSLEVSPYLARDTKGTIEEARRLWKEVGRPDVMIKIPGTAEGIPAIEQLTGEGININVTLLFAQEVYEQAALAYVAGLEKYAKTGGDLRRIASVASFFISRIDTLVDSLLNEKLRNAAPDQQPILKNLLGKVAIANGKLAYQRFLRIFSGPRWDALAKKGAQVQRVLWASTSTKNPAYRDVIYVEELIGKDTVNTMPPNTVDAFREHGKVRESLTEDVDGARKTMDDLAKAGISIQQVTDKLTEDAIKLFSDPFDKLLQAIEKTRKKEITPKLTKQDCNLPKDLQDAVSATVEDWQKNNKARRLWQRDASVWTGKDEANWLGWLDVVEEQIAHAGDLRAFADEVKKAGFTHVLLLGMGGSSLAPEVLAKTFGNASGYPELHVLDSTDPEQVRAVEKKIDVRKTLFIVSSKSGSTLEPNIFKQYFFERVKQAAGADKAGSQFVAITDPGSQMEQVAQRDHFRHIFHGRPSIGGRYSAMSNFGMVPAATLGIDTNKFLDRTEQMVQACAASVPVHQNPGVMLGIVIGTAAKKGCDKLTIITSPGISDLGAWLEQLLAESTGKEGKGMIPVDREPLGPAEAYGNDRLFAYLRLESEAESAVEAKLGALEKAGHPVLRISLGDKYDLGQEFFRWEIATAVAGSVIGINPFNQPDVEASKLETRKLTSEYEKTGSLPAETPLLEDGGIKLFANPKNADALTKAAKDKSLTSYLRAHLGRIRPGDYFAVLGYVEMNQAHEDALQASRLAVRDAKKVATCLGFGPRFLHSTGQAYKGGPNSGVFLQVTCDHPSDLPVPGQKYTFGTVEAAQARGDFQVLAERGRRALRVHFADVEKGLAALNQAIAQALS